MSADDEERWGRFIQGLRDGDAAVVRAFCEQYGPQLERLADRHLGAAVRRRVGPEDVVQSACRTFLRRARGGELRLADSEGLWRLLCAITLTKAREQARFHLRQRRGLDREQPLAADDDSAAGARPPEDPRPTPAEAAELADFFEQVMKGLDEEERQVVDLRLQDCTNEEAAERLGVSERTVRRILKRVQARLTQALGEG
jgi:RNA polymerase sigma factor (sigma-70 family)